jgi:DNA polymerase-3 subunit beta
MNKATFNTIKKICGSKSLIIIEKTVHIDHNGILATNLDTYINVGLPKFWRVTGAGVLSLDILAALIDAKNVSLNFSDGLCIIEVDGRTIAAPYMDSRDYPLMPLGNDASEASGEVYGQDIAAVLDFIGKDIFRPAMTGVYIGKHIVGTNGHIMRYRQSNFDGVPFILRREAAEAIKVQAVAGKMFKGPAQKWHVEQGREYVAFYYGDIMLLSRKIQDTYPNYLAVIPKDNMKTLTVNVKEINGALKMLAPIYKTGTTKAVALEFGDAGAVKMSATYLTGDGQTSTPLSAYADNFASGFKMGFNAEYLSKITSNIVAQTMVIEIGDNNRAAIINNEVLLMPVMLNV